MNNKKEKAFIRSYNEVKDVKKLVDMNLQQMTGYYLSNYSNDPIGMLTEDIYQMRVPYTVGESVKVLIGVVRGM